MRLQQPARDSAAQTFVPNLGGGGRDSTSREISLAEGAFQTPNQNRVAEWASCSGLCAVGLHYREEH